MIPETRRNWTGKFWLGETFAYWCKENMLFQVADDKGLKYIKAECVTSGIMDPWWVLSSPIKSCKSDLEEGMYFYFIQKVIQLP